MKSNEEEAVRISRVVARNFTLRIPHMRDEFESEALVAAAEALSTYDENNETSFTTWAHKIINWRLRDFLRKWLPGVRRGAHLQYISIDGAMEEKGDPEWLADPSTEIEIDLSQQVTEAIEFVLTRMRKEQADVIRWWLKGTTLKEGAERYGWTESRGSQILKEFRRRLRVQLAMRDIVAWREV